MNESNGTATDLSAETVESNNNIQHELAFLVTHWLANYGNAYPSANGTHHLSNDVLSRATAATSDEQQQRVAIERIRRATAEIASAFASLGAYGTTFRPSFTDGGAFFEHRSFPRNSTFSDVSRRHARLPASHLEHLAQSAAFNSAAADVVALRNVRTNLLLRATSSGESLRRKQQQSSDSGGRTLQDVIVLDGDDSPVTAEGMNNFSLSYAGMSILENPALIQPSSADTDGGTSLTNTIDSGVLLPTERNFEPLPNIDIQPTQWDVAHRTAETVREFLRVREKVQATDHEIRSIQASLTLQRLNMAELEAKLSSISQNSNLGTAESLDEIGGIKSSQQGSDRVTSQLQRKLIDLNSTQGSNRIGLAELESKVRELDKTRQDFITSFRDPFATWKGPLSKDNRVGGCAVLNAVLSRQRGLSRLRHSQVASKFSLSKGRRPSHFLEMRKDILATKLSHAVTINAHQNCPVYCLRFDRTGRYFITGADDYLLKVFFLGAGQSCRTRNEADGSRLLRCNYGANFRGAVLVCSLRGHAGVINDIAVSTDNCFLATASVDGDVRIWGLKNGCPIAILRGHGGGANMVSWSTLTPFRLVSTGSDGFARVWDIREACLKRYASEVGSRNEYKLNLTSEEKRTYEEYQQKEATLTKRFLPQDVAATPPVLGTAEPGTAQVDPEDHPSRIPLGPPLEAVAAGDVVGAVGIPSDTTDLSLEDTRSGGIVIPPLPGTVPALGHEEEAPGLPAEDQDDAADPVDPGQFVANDLIDEGVKLLVKYQHGNAHEDQQHGPGTRSRRTAINVICVAHSPLGKQFATGSDDGICRVWEDYDDGQIALIDKRMSGRVPNLGSSNPSPPSSGTECKPLLKLMGHVSTITDLAYSYSGDRILSASQKDGIVRIWTVGSSAISARTRHDATKDKRLHQIVIKLTNPTSKQAVPASRRRHGTAARNPANMKVSCDVAVWTHDDSKIVTSQCVQLKQNGNEIQPGSQFLFLWDSRSGHCLIGISGAHSMQCPVVVPHPSDSSIVCTAAADGYVKIWDWEQGKCIYTHQNKVESGPPDPNNPNKIAGFLDGAFSRDGTEIVLTDDSGQVTILSSITDHKTQTKNGESSAWTREQYFANDYYELAYDRNGYCIEKGSEYPPHLAPKGARCTHSGAAYSDEVNETFRNLAGPTPLPENICLWNREETRVKRTRSGSEAVRSGDTPSVRIGVREFDPLSTIIVRGSDHVQAATFSPNARKSTESLMATSDASRPASAAGNPSHRTLSANFRYLDYDDLVRREGNPEEDEQDSDDEEFQPAAPNRHHDNASEESNDDNLDDDNSLYSGSLRRRRHHHSARAEQRRVRATRRAQRRDNDFTEIGSDDDMIAQFVSSNTKPTGPYERDFLIAGHIWRLKSQSDARRVHRRWLRREESDSSYFGRKIYAPQLGDSVVYIPRAHYETIKDFPSLQPPWQTWPTGTAWPVVRCFVRGVRFRFPYEDYFRKGHTTCGSIIAILTLEVTGIPELSHDREFPWPKPSFVEPTRPFVFELSVFENSHCEYLIPESLYTSRLEALETNIRSRGMVFEGLEVDLYYDAEQHGEDEEMKVFAFSVKDRIEDEDCPSSVHLQKSGYSVLQVEGDDGYEDAASPWELNTEGANLIRPCLAEDEKKSVIAVLNSLLEKKDVAEHLSMPVDQERYSDYASMVEVAMDIMFVKRRLAENYYSSKLGVAGDLLLIRDNCVKYNTLDNEMSETACKMCSDYQQKILSTEEREQIVTEDTYNNLSQQQFEGRQGTTIRIRMSSTRHQGGSDTPSSSSARRYTLRDRTGAQPRSSLESLPIPEGGTTSGRGRRQIGSSEVGTRRTARQQIQNGTETLGQESHGRTQREDADSTRIYRAQRQRRSESNTHAEDQDVASYEHPQDVFLNPRRGSRRPLRGEIDQDDHLASPRRSSRVANDVRTLRQSGRSRATLRSTQDNESVSFETNHGQQPSRRGTRRSTRSTNNSQQIRQEEKGDDDSEPQGEAREVYDDNYGIFRESRSMTARPNTRSKRSNHSFGDEDDDTTEDYEDAEEKPQRRLARNRNHRSTRANSKRAPATSQWTDEVDESVDDGSMDDYKEDSSAVESHDSDDDVYDESSEAPRKTRNRELSSPSRNSRHAKGRAEAASPTSPGRRSNRTATRLRASYHEVESDVDVDEVSDSDASDEVEVPRKRACRRNEKRNATYSFDFLSDDDQDSEDEISSTNRNGRKAGSSQRAKRKVGKKSSNREPTSKKRRVDKSVKKLPVIQRWPKIDIQEITNVVAAVVAKMSEYDHDNVFSAPVVEAYPEIAASYLKTIKRPMDLRTIAEERIHSYESIAKLQDDLMLMCRNCCTFNGHESELWQYGKTIYERINEVFLDVCTELGVELPVGWSPR